MSPDENKEIIRLYIDEVWGEHDVEALERFVSPEYKRHIAPTVEPLDLDGQKARLTGLWRAFPDARLTIEDIFAEHDRVAFRSVMHGTHSGTFQGLEPTGKSVTVTVLDVVRLENGVVTDHWGGPDMFDLLRQLR